MKNIVLIGMPGCGKTTIGRRIGKRFPYEFFDADEYVEKMTGKKISELFEHGEDYFRDKETEACMQLSLKENAVISTGGGVVKRNENINILKNNSVIIFIDRPVEKIIGDIDVSKRPLLKDGKEKILKLYDERYELYKKAADKIVINDGSFECAVDKIADIIEQL